MHSEWGSSAGRRGDGASRGKCRACRACRCSHSSLSPSKTLSWSSCCPLSPGALLTFGSALKGKTRHPLLLHLPPRQALCLKMGVPPACHHPFCCRPLPCPQEPLLCLLACWSESFAGTVSMLLPWGPALRSPEARVDDHRDPCRLGGAGPRGVASWQQVGTWCSDAARQWTSDARCLCCHGRCSLWEITCLKRQPPTPQLSGSVCVTKKLRRGVCDWP